MAEAIADMVLPPVDGTPTVVGPTMVPPGRDTAPARHRGTRLAEAAERAGISEPVLSEALLEVVEVWGDWSRGP